MTKEELAAKLNGRQMGSEITRAEEDEAKTSGLIVIIGASDDLVELVGAIDEEMSANLGTKFLLLPDGPLPDADEFKEAHESLMRHRVLKQAAQIRLQTAIVSAEWDVNGYSWFIAATVPFAAFDIMEDNELFCRGIVIDVKDLWSPA